MKTQRKQVIWIVEIKFDGYDFFEPTVGITLNHEDGREVLKEWQRKNPDDKFRLVAYVRR